MRRFIVLILYGYCNIHHVMAEDVQPMSAVTSSTATPSSTEQWLELQRSGVYASPHAQPLSGDVMDKVHKRYLKSFEKPIPEFYEHEMRVTR